MRQKALHLIVTFHTTAEAMATEQLCKRENLPGRLISAPRTVSADCGIAWCVPAQSGAPVRQAIDEAGIEVAGYHELLL